MKVDGQRMILAIRLFNFSKQGITIPSDGVDTK